jgi:hypothetical protein
MRNNWDIIVIQYSIGLSFLVAVVPPNQYLDTSPDLSSLAINVPKPRKRIIKKIGSFIGIFSR